MYIYCCNHGVLFLGRLLIVSKHCVQGGRSRSCYLHVYGRLAASRHHRCHHLHPHRCVNVCTYCIPILEAETFTAADGDIDAATHWRVSTVSRSSWFIVRAPHRPSFLSSMRWATGTRVWALHVERPSSCKFNALNQGRIAIGNATRSIRRLFMYVDLLLPHWLSSDRWVSRRSQVWAREVRRALGVGAGFECECEPCEEHRRLHTLVVPWLRTTHEGGTGGASMGTGVVSRWDCMLPFPVSCRCSGRGVDGHSPRVPVDLSVAAELETCSTDAARLGSVSREASEIPNACSRGSALLQCSCLRARFGITCVLPL